MLIFFYFSFTFRLIDHVLIDSSAATTVENLEAAYKESCQQEGWFAFSMQKLGKILRKLFPEVIYSTKRSKGGHTILYRNLKLVEPEEEHPLESLDFIPHGSFLLQKDNNFMKLGIVTSILTNGNRVVVELTVTNSSFQFQVRGKKINNDLLCLSNNFKLTKGSLEKLVYIAKKMKICCGVSKKPTETLDNYILEIVSHVGDENSSEERLRCSVFCKQVVAWTSNGNTCRSCQKNYYSTLPKQEESAELNLSQEDPPTVLLDEESASDMETILKDVFSGASDSMKVLLASQHKVLQKKNKCGMRWPKAVISLCLNLWIRSPKSYEDLKDSKMLTLPSGRQLSRYKNAVNQRPGINRDMLRWMKKTADDANIPPAGRTGILMHDEAKLQQDIVLVRHEDTFRLIGWVDMGEEAFLTQVMKTGTVKRELATDALQLVYLGHTGFRFPVAHFAATASKAHELYVILWNAISALGEWGFNVDAIVQDGGEQNREFMKMLFPDGDPVGHNCIVKNPTNLERNVAISQDFSHCVKKLRNSILSSGHETAHTRCCKFKDSDIIWKQWIAAVNWDRDINSRLIHFRVTDAHIFPNQSEKMRNKLAEEMMNADMLNLMLAYQSSYPNGHHLDAAVQLLRQTSALIHIFRDTRPVKSMSDERLQTLDNISQWFQNWENGNKKDTTIPENKKRQSLPSKECLEDLHILIKSFQQVCEMRCQDYPGWGIVPSRFNTDLVENQFCQQRGLFNGNATHPNLATYSHTVNSIIIGQTSKSRGRKSNAGFQKAPSYTFCRPENKKKAKLPRL